VHETPAIGFLKQLRHYSKVIKIMTGLLFQLHLSLIKLAFNQTQQSEMIFDFAINQYYPTKIILPIWI
jgi:hypothetical protein